MLRAPRHLNPALMAIYSANSRRCFYMSLDILKTSHFLAKHQRPYLLECFICSNLATVSLDKLSKRKTWHALKPVFFYGYFKGIELRKAFLNGQEKLKTWSSHQSENVLMTAKAIHEAFDDSWECILGNFSEACGASFIDIKQNVISKFILTCYTFLGDTLQVASWFQCNSSLHLEKCLLDPPVLMDCSLKRYFWLRNMHNFVLVAFTAMTLNGMYGQRGAVEYRTYSVLDAKHSIWVQACLEYRIKHKQGHFSKTLSTFLEYTRIPISHSFFIWLNNFDFHKEHFSKK